MDLALVVMAAGMGSRFGGLKQLKGLGPNEELLLEYSLFDASKAGFNRIVIVIQKSMEQAFTDLLLPRFKGKLDITFAFQELDTALPNNFELPLSRKKPWGTAHALLAAKPHVSTPFLVINADDFYGPTAYPLIADFLKKAAPNEYALVGYPLAKTLSPIGGVSRAVCVVDQESKLKALNQFEDVEETHPGLIAGSQGKQSIYFDGDALASMNFWGFHPEIFPYLEKAFHAFLEGQGTSNSSAEFGLPTVVESLLGEKTVKVLPTQESWFGVTYADDAPFVSHEIQELVDSGIYPKKLWA